MRKKWYSGKRTLLVFSTAFLALASCGENNGSNKSVQSSQQQEQDSGSFKAELTPLNAQVAGGISGTADVTVNGDDVTIKVNVKGAPVTMHAQHLHAGSACPTQAADKNGDGFVDGAEANAVSGNVLIPFDSDINSQDQGEGNYPSGASYTYSEQGSLSQINKS